ncbi:hypothetical protein [Lactobacillus terrae]|uniref:hypothetical protein n=1 Tax=Lactobacillus terrae TaxID=2269374 RepID=UPI000C1B6F22|nr:hypothetical protein [Lactobacillus terrae]
MPLYPDSSPPGQTFRDTVYYGKYNMTSTGYIAMDYQYSILFLYGFDNYNKPKSSINKDIALITVYGNAELLKTIEENYSNLRITGSGKDDITFKVEINDKNQATFTQSNKSKNKYILLESDNRRMVTSLDDMLQLNISNSDLTIY